MQNQSQDEDGDIYNHLHETDVKSDQEEYYDHTHPVRNCRNSDPEYYNQTFAIERKNCMSDSTTQRQTFHIVDDRNNAYFILEKEGQ
jgi:hypothetical protein